ncbi:MAG TPA: Gfo/Idh/MocA family oxidoreductase [Vicinamibacterales bacterium]|jgi:UDP-N-acetyl-2-amino-2-deoxyglucuronate dehydrogenase|nr:Gfo/Idh/MocA family oxidoreductase [Vicinamibacterales bacterium]
MSVASAPRNFALTGAAGYIAPRHLQAIRDTGNRLVAAVDPHDAVGVLDRFGFDVRFFTEIERFDRHLEKLRRGPSEDRVHYVSICSPNYLHDAHIRLALRGGAHAICEKPLVINPWNLDALRELEEETGGRVNTVLQLRLHPDLIALRRHLQQQGGADRHEVSLTYVTARGRWYDVSWKGSEERSGGIVTNIGIHLFDLLLWLFGPVVRCDVHLREARRMAGFIELERARVRWFLSTDRLDLPFVQSPGGKTTFRSITVDGREVEFSDGFTDLHTRVYEEALAGRGFGIEDSRPAVELSYRIRQTPASAGGSPLHPFLTAR